MKMAQVQTYIITGFLGSGKTTFIKRILKEKNPREEWAIVINEFGSVSIDSEVIRKERNKSGEIYEIPGGCICCSAKDTLKQNLELIANSGKFDRIIIEPSGLGGIDMIEEIVYEIGILALMPSVCMVDITAANNTRIKINMLFRSQIFHSKYVFFTKTDLLNEAQIEENKTYFRNNFGVSAELEWKDVSQLFQLSVNENETTKRKQNTSAKAFFPASLSLSEYESTVLRTDPILQINPHFLKDLLCKYQEVIRAKGYIKTSESWILFNYSITGFSTSETDIHKQNEVVVIFENGEPQILKKIQEEIISLFQ